VVGQQPVFGSDAERTRSLDALAFFLKERPCVASISLRWTSSLDSLTESWHSSFFHRSGRIVQLRRNFILLLHQSLHDLPPVSSANRFTVSSSANGVTMSLNGLSVSPPAASYSAKMDAIAVGQAASKWLFCVPWAVTLIGMDVCSADAPGTRTRDFADALNTAGCISDCLFSSAAGDIVRRGVGGFSQASMVQDEEKQFWWCSLSEDPAITDRVIGVRRRATRLGAMERDDFTNSTEGINLCLGALSGGHSCFRWGCRRFSFAAGEVHNSSTSATFLGESTCISLRMLTGAATSSAMPQCCWAGVTLIRQDSLPLGQGAHTSKEVVELYFSYEGAPDGLWVVVRGVLSEPSSALRV